MRILALAVPLALILASGTPASPLCAQERAHELLQRGLVLERSAGDVVGALELYRQVVQDHADEREVAARALLQMAAAYQRLEHPGAVDAYRRVLEEYPDRSEARRRAADALAALGVPATRTDAPDRDPTYTLLIDELPENSSERPAVYDVSPDGTRIALIGRTEDGERALLVTDRAGVVARTLATASRLGGVFRGIRWSPDGRSILVAGRQSLHVVPADGGEPRRVVRFDDPGESLSFEIAWSPDGRSVAYALQESGQIRVRSLNDPSNDVRLEAPTLGYTARIGGYSPDGRWLALDLPPEDDERRERDIWLVPAGGGRALQVTHAPGSDSHPAWGPDGRLYFVSERSGSSNLWRLAIDAATGLPRGEPERLTSYEDARVIHPRVTESHGVTYELRRDRAGIRVGPTDRPEASRLLARGMGPELSPDGRVVVFEGQGPGQQGLFVMELDGGSPSRLTEGRNLGSFKTWALSPDGRDVAFLARTDDGPALFRVPVGGGGAVKLADGGSFPAWSPDGSRIAFCRGNGLYVVSRDGGEPERLATLWSWDSWTLRWSPDGEHLASIGWSGPPAQRGEHQNDVFVVPASGGEPRRISGADEWQYKEFLDWRPDGEAVTYMYYDPAEPAPGGDTADGLRIAYLDGRPTELFIDRTETWDYWGVWAPDGSSFVFMASGNERPGWALYRRATETGEVTLFWDGESSLPSFSRDGSTAAWSVESTSSQLWLVEPER